MMLKLSYFVLFCLMVAHLFKHVTLLHEDNESSVLIWVTDLPYRIYKDIEELKKDFTEGALHPGDLKPALSTGLNKILQVRF